MTGRLNDKCAIITGGASGIGAATAARFVREGANVLLVDWNADRLATTVQQIEGTSPQVLSYQADIRNEDSVKALVEMARQAWGRIDILVNNAGIGGGGDIQQATLADYDRIMGVNFQGTFLCCKYAIPLMQERGGAIVNIASISASVGIPSQSIYAPSKAAVQQLTRQLAIEYAKQGIRVNAISPGTIDTPLIDGLRTPERRAKLEWLLAHHPIGRFGTPDEVANAILFLASEEASFITGANLAVDGGYTAE